MKSKYMKRLLVLNIIMLKVVCSDKWLISTDRVQEYIPGLSEGEKMKPEYERKTTSGIESE